jgi:hypothetical protein
MGKETAREGFVQNKIQEARISVLAHTPGGGTRSDDRSWSTVWLEGRWLKTASSGLGTFE